MDNNIKSHFIERYINSASDDDRTDFKYVLIHLFKMSEADISTLQNKHINYPCNIGDTIYFVCPEGILNFSVIGFSVSDNTITSISVKNEYNYHCDLNPNGIGKNVFFTKDEADKKFSSLNIF